MAISPLILLCLVGTAIAHADMCYAPGTTVTTTSTKTVTVSAGSGSGILGQNAELIKSTFAKARKDGDFAPQILFRFLKAHPSYQQMFPSFANVPQNQLLKNGNFLSQAYTILAGMNVIIQSAGSDELLAQEVQQLGAAHYTRGVSPSMFDELADVIIDVLQDELGSDFSQAAKQAWQQGLRALSAGVSKSLKKAEDLADPRTGLTPHQIADVRRSWQNVRAGRAGLVSDLFLRLFREQPSLQQLFSRFADVPVGSLSGNAEFNKQVNLVADRVDAIVNDLDSVLKTQGEVNYMAFSHKSRGVGRQHFETFNRIFVDLLGSRGVSSDDLDSWRGALGVLSAAIGKIQNY